MLSLFGTLLCEITAPAGRKNVFRAAEQCGNNRVCFRKCSEREFKYLNNSNMMISL